MSVEDLIKTLLQEFRQIVRTETVVGEPVVVGETAIVPVSKISFGFGAGGGGKGDKSEGGKGTGGGGSVEPVAFIVIRDGKAQLLPLAEKEMSIKKLLDFSPDLIQNVKTFREKREKKKAREAEGDSETDRGDVV